MEERQKGGEDAGRDEGRREGMEGRKGGRREGREEGREGGRKEGKEYVCIDFFVLLYNESRDCWPVGFVGISLRQNLVSSIIYV